MALPTRRFGRTELEIPLLSLGGMRFQQSWTDLPADEITSASQTQLEATLKRAVDLGFHHVETARHYGSSERQLGWALPRPPDPSRLLQSKVPPRPDPDAFEAELELSFERLGCDRLDLLAIHGINLPEHLEQTLQPGGCMEVVRRWQAEGRIGHVGFSTHGPTALIAEACDSGAFDYVNLHWYYIRQDNGPALDAARRQDMGLFIISPTDKGGHLHSPSQRLLELCAPLHPIVFNDLFCLNDPRVHYWEPAKWTARMRDLATGDSMLLLKTNMGAGHGGSSGRYDYLREIAFEFAFMLDHLDATEVIVGDR